MFVLDAAGRKRAWPLRLLRRPRRSKSTEKKSRDRRPIGRAVLKAPGLADRRCRGQRIVSPAAASSPSLAPMVYPKGRRAIRDQENCMFADGRPLQAMAHVRQNLVVATLP
jgi:hypothetical protein